MAGAFGHIGRAIFATGGGVQAATGWGLCGAHRLARGGTGERAGMLRRCLSAASLPNRSFQRTVKMLRISPATEFNR
jgi:hypothetical protein